jgi:hypothetical protein
MITVSPKTQRGGKGFRIYMDTADELQHTTRSDPELCVQQ